MMLKIEKCKPSLPTPEERAETIFWCKLLVLLAVAAWLMHLAIYGLPIPAPTNALGESGGLEALFDAGGPITIAAVFMALAGWLPLGRRESWAIAVATLGFAAWFWVKKEHGYIMPGAFLLLGFPLGCYLVLRGLVVLLRARKLSAPVPEWVALFCWLAVGLTASGRLTHIMLGINQVIIPGTWDFHLYKIDAAFGGIAQSVAEVSKSSPEWVQVGTVYTYAILGVLFIPLIALVYRENKARALHVWRAVILPFCIAWICYAWIPATGPGFIWPENYPANAPLPSEVPAIIAYVTSAPRNAMPSMHFSGAILVFMITAALRRKWLFALSVPFVIWTGWATLALGHHYLVDLVVAMSFAPALGVALMDTPKWRQLSGWSRVSLWASFATFGFWMLAIRLASEWLQQNPTFVQILSIWSVSVGLVLLALHVRCVWDDRWCREDSALLVQSNKVDAWTAPAFLPPELHGNRWLVGIFFFSGFAGLVYEVVYAKALGVTFGGTALAANTVLMTYMGGMALGSWIGGILAERSRNPLMLYVLMEAGIGIYALITPALFTGIQAIYVATALDAPPDAVWLTGLRMALGAAVLGVPTVLMGATLPLVFQCLRRMGIPTSRAIAPLYGANVLGAAVGALVAGYALLPSLGRSGGTLLAAVISLLVALYVLEKLKRGADRFDGAAAEPGLGVSERGRVLPVGIEVVSKRLGASALTVLVVGGTITLALEVVFMHLLAVVAGNSVYAFGLMLATFLAGLGLGAAIGERLMRDCDRRLLVIWAQSGIALAILLTSFVWDGLAEYMGSFGHAQQQGLQLSFSARELVRAMVCMLAMLPPAFFIGMSYPAAMGLASDWLAVERFHGAAARGVGVASAFNTLGNIAGVLLAAFWWLPQYGSRNVLLGLAVSAVALALLMAWSVSPAMQDTRRYWLSRWASPLLVLVTLLAFPAHWNYTALSQGGNVYFYPQNWGEVIDSAESVEGGMTTVARAENGQLTLLTNGKFQGNNVEGGEMVAQESIAMIPLLHTDARGSALVIGYGTGMTARVLQDQGFTDLDVAETSRDIAIMADKYFANINARISSHPAVRMHYTDGRNYLLTQSKKYDLISLEISSIWFAGAANLYNREFYALAKQRLNQGGVLQQWVQLHHMRPLDFLYIISSLRSEFRYVWVYVSGGQGILVASNDDAALHANGERLFASGHAISSLDVHELPKTLVADPEQVDAFIHRFDPSMQAFVSTDNNLYLEYATPKGNAVREDTASILIGMLQGRE